MLLLILIKKAEVIKSYQFLILFNIYKSPSQYTSIYLSINHQLHPMRTCLSALLLIQSVSAAYVLNKTQQLPSANYTAVAMAFRPLTVNGGAFDVAMGLANGTIFLSNTDNLDFRTSFEAFSGSPVVEMDWTEFGIFALSTKSLKVLDASSLKPMVELSFSEPIEHASVGYQGTGAGRIITAVSFADRIQVYEDTTLVINRSTRSACRALAVDHTAKFLHYFDSQVRSIVNIQTRSDLVNVTTTTDRIGLVGSSAANNENVTISLNSAGGLEVWDQSVLLFAESAATHQTQLKLTGNSDQLFTYSPIGSVITVWPIDYNKLTNWHKSQEISQVGSSSNNDRPLAMDAKNNRLVYLSGGSLMVYAPDHSQSNLLIVLVVLVALLCCCGLCLVVNKKYGIRNLLTGFASRRKVEEDSAKYAQLQENNNINQSYGLNENEQINASISAKNANTL